MNWYLSGLIGLGILALFICYVISVGNIFKGFLNDERLFKYLVASQIQQSPDKHSDNLILIRKGSFGLTIWYNPAPFSCYKIDGLGYIRRWTKSHRYLERIRKMGRNIKERKYELVFEITLPLEK